MKRLPVRKLILATSFIGVVLFIVCIFSRQLHICPPYSYSTCAVFFEGVAETLLPILPLFLFSLITYFLPLQVFRSWLRFAMVWIPLSMLLILVVPTNDVSVIPIDKGRVAFVTSLCFMVISFIIIAISFVRGRTDNQKG